METIVDAGAGMNSWAHYTLRVLALCYRTSGRKYYIDSATRDHILTRLEKLYKTLYDPNLSYGNTLHWWLFEIGIPLRLPDILCLMYEELPDCDAFIRKHTELTAPIMQFFCPMKNAPDKRCPIQSNLLKSC